MARGILDALVLFLLPFAGYGVWLAARRRYPFLLKSWTGGPLAVLVVSGLALAVAGMLATGFLSGRHRGAYAPAHIENGVLVPGKLE